MGRVGRVAETREWVVSPTPYFLVYAVDAETVTILRVLHGKQHWPGPSP
jgi:toxin ParE1/3/4